MMMTRLLLLQKGTWKAGTADRLFKLWFLILNVSISECFQTQQQHHHHHHHHHQQWNLPHHHHLSTSSRSMTSTAHIGYSHGSASLCCRLLLAPNSPNYNDDAFGFVFLGSLALTQDPFFAGTFLILSAVAALATRQHKVPATQAVPAAVAGLTLVLSFLIRDEISGVVVPPLQEWIAMSLPLPQNSAWIQVGLCTVSMIYGFVMAAKEDGTS